MFIPGKKAILGFHPSPYIPTSGINIDTPASGKHIFPLIMSIDNGSIISNNETARN